MGTVPLLRIGSVLVLAGGIWLAAAFGEGQKVTGGDVLERGGSFEVGLEFAGDGIGFYRIEMPGFDGRQTVFVQVLDPGGNVVGEKMVQTRMSVEYFDYGGDGTYAIRITNVSDGAAGVQAELGDTNSDGMLLPGIVTLAGSLTLIATSYFWLRDYSMAHPDENIR